MGSSSSTLSQADFNKMLSASGQIKSGCQCDLSEVKANISSNTDQIKGLSANGISDTVISEMNKAGPIKDDITKQITDIVQQNYVKSSDLQSLITKDGDGNIVIGQDGATSVQFGSTQKPLALAAGDVTSSGKVTASSVEASSVEALTDFTLSANGYSNLHVEAKGSDTVITAGDGTKQITLESSLSVKGELDMNKNDIDHVGKLTYADVSGSNSTAYTVLSGNELGTIVNTDSTTSDKYPSNKDVDNATTRGSILFGSPVNASAININPTPSWEAHNKFPGDTKKEFDGWDGHGHLYVNEGWATSKGTDIHTASVSASTFNASGSYRVNSGACYGPSPSWNACSS